MENLKGFYELLGQIEAIHFDLDGTLIKSEKAWLHSDIDLLREHGVEVPVSEIKNIREGKLIGRGQEFASKFFKEKFNLSAPVKRIKDRRISLVKQYYKSVPLRNGAASFLQLVGRSRLKVTLVTSSPLVLAEIFLERRDFANCFDQVLSDDHVSESKPDPEIFLKAGKAVEVEPQRSLVVEDSKNGVLAAKKAGTHCLWAPTNGFSGNWDKMAERADFIVEDFGSLNLKRVESLLD